VSSLPGFTRTGFIRGLTAQQRRALGFPGESSAYWGAAVAKAEALRLYPELAAEQQRVRL
jgi:hypothetical protein